MQHKNRDIYKPSLFLTINYKLPEKEHYLKLLHEKIADGKSTRVKDHGTDVGLYMLDNNKMQKVYRPIFDKLGIPHAKISYIYIHYAQLGGKFKIHTHDKPHFVHYQQVPINCGSIFFPDFEDEMYQHPPKEDKFLIIPEGIPHGISIHKNTALRIAITGQLENLI